MVEDVIYVNGVGKRSSNTGNVVCASDNVFVNFRHNDKGFAFCADVCKGFYHCFGFDFEDENQKLMYEQYNDCFGNYIWLKQDRFESCIRLGFDQHHKLKIHIVCKTKMFAEKLVETLKNGSYIMEETKILSFDEYLKYCRLNGKERTLYLQRLKDKLTKEGFQTQEAFQISFETDYDSSDFNNRDIYVDMLNHTYIFL